MFLIILCTTVIPVFLLSIAAYFYYKRQSEAAIVHGKDYYSVIEHKVMSSDEMIVKVIDMDEHEHYVKGQIGFWEYYKEAEKTVPDSLFEIVNDYMIKDSFKLERETYFKETSSDITKAVIEKIEQDLNINISDNKELTLECEVIVFSHINF